MCVSPDESLQCQREMAIPSKHLPADSSVGQSGKSGFRPKRRSAAVRSLRRTRSALHPNRRPFLAFWSVSSWHLRQPDAGLSKRADIGTGAVDVLVVMLAKLHIPRVGVFMCCTAWPAYRSVS